MLLILAKIQSSVAHGQNNLQKKAQKITLTKFDDGIIQPAKAQIGKIAALGDAKIIKRLLTAPKVEGAEKGAT